MYRLISLNDPVWLQARLLRLIHPICLLNLMPLQTRVLALAILRNPGSRSSMLLVHLLVLILVLLNLPRPNHLRLHLHLKFRLLHLLLQRNPSLNVQILPDAALQLSVHQISRPLSGNPRSLHESPPLNELMTLANLKILRPQPVLLNHILWTQQVKPANGKALLYNLKSVANLRPRKNSCLSLLSLFFSRNFLFFFVSVFCFVPCVLTEFLSGQYLICTSCLNFR